MRLAPEVEARVIDLPDALRAWVHEEPVARLCLAAHVFHGQPLVDCLASIACAIGVDGVLTVGDRLHEGESANVTGAFAARDARRFP